MSEKRIHKRKLVNSNVKLFHSSFGEIEAITGNISNGGIFVIAPSSIDLSPGSELKMQLLDSSDPNVVFNMQVVRHDNAGMGLMFVNFEAYGEIYEMKKLNLFWSR